MQKPVFGPYQTLKVELDSREFPGVLSVKLNRPDIRNAFNETMIDELTRVFSQDVLHPEVKIVTLGGEGPAFSAGGDLNWMKRSVTLDLEQNLTETRTLSKMFATMNECPKPLVGFIHGAAIGGGVGLTSVCDIVVATQDTQFSLSEVRLGIVPACIGPFVTAKIGATHSRALFVSAERFSARRALEIGLIHEMVSDAIALESARGRLLGNMLQCGPQAMSVAKKLVLDLTWPERREKQTDCLEYVSRTLAELRVSPEGQEGLKAFLEKRKPGWIR
jgi:methylglutaconyl-CoA hydratase